jgi:hypothetical protein
MRLQLFAFRTAFPAIIFTHTRRMPKLLVSGDASDPLAVPALLARVAKLHASPAGPFDALLVTGLSARALDALAASPADAAFPLPTYCLLLGGGDGPGDAAAADLFAEGGAQAAARRLTCLGGRGTGGGVVTLPGGLRCAFLGAGAAADSAVAAAAAHSASGGGGGGVVDILLSRDWPKGVLSGVSVAALPPAAAAAFYDGAPGCASAAQALSPRYHFVGGRSVFYQRPPFGTAAGHVSRFVSLGDVVFAPGGDEKRERKWLHALNLQAGDSMDMLALRETPGGTTPSPYGAGAGKHGPDGAGDGGAAKRARVGGGDGGFASASSSSSSSSAGFGAGGLSMERVAQLEAESAAGGGQFFWSLRGGRGRGGGGAGQRGQRGPGGAGPGGMPPRNAHPGGAAPSSSSSSSFPSSSSSSSSSSLPPPECWFCLASPHVEKHLVVAVGAETYLALPKGGISEDHFLIIPIAHHDSMATAPPAVQTEAQRFLDGLAALFATRGLALVAFERVLHRGGRGDVPLHTHLQVLGLPLQAASRAESAFLEEARYHRLEPGFERLPATVSLAESVHAVVPAPGTPGASTGPARATIEYLFVEVPDPAGVAAIASRGGGGGGPGGEGPRRRSRLRRRLLRRPLLLLHPLHRRPARPAPQPSACCTASLPGRGTPSSSPGRCCAA